MAVTERDVRHVARLARLEVKDGERIAQLVIARYQRVTFTEVADLAVSERGAGGFGHTGRN